MNGAEYTEKGVKRAAFHENGENYGVLNAHLSELEDKERE